jgi:hypothetical protein
MLRAEAERDANRDDSDLDALTQGDPWAVLRAQLLDLAFVFPDYAPAELDTARASRLLELLTATMGKLRHELRTIERRLAEIDSEAALQYLSPDAPPPAVLDMAGASKQLELVAATLGKLRHQLRTIERRRAEIDSLVALQYLSPGAAPPPPTVFDMAGASKQFELVAATFGKLGDELLVNAQRSAEIETELQTLINRDPDAAPAPTRTVDSVARKEHLVVDLGRLRETLGERGELKEDGQRIDDYRPVPSAAELRPVPSATQLAETPLERAGLKTANLTFNKRTGLWLHRMDGREIVALPSKDDVEPSDDYLLELFDIIRSPKADGCTPDFIIPGPDGRRLEVRMNRSSALRRTRATRPRQISAAIAALEARQTGNHVAGRYAVVARTLGMPPEKPFVVQRLVASVTKLISNSETEALVRFLAPREVNINKVIERVLIREKASTKTRNAQKKK